MNKNFNPQKLEQKIYEDWESSGDFNANPNSKARPFCIMMPPPNVTGTLHMGQGFQNALMDALIRYKRMCGYDVLWQVGTDHAGIATQMVVERQLEKEGSTREGIGRERFEKRVWKWKESSGNEITKQLRRLGASVDWSRETFTLDPKMSETVKEVFIRLYDEGLIYRGKRLVNWDVHLQTALSDLEVSNKEEIGNLWFFQYPIIDGKTITIATTRPETMLGDTAVAVNTKDKRYKNLIGKKVLLPICNREIPIIADDFVDSEFGTGCLKITPGHDFNDFEIGKRHNLPSLNILNLDGTLNDQVPKSYRGLSIQEARKRVLEDLTALNLVEKTVTHKREVPRGDRSNSVLEPILTNQWFVDVKKLSKEAVKVVEEGKTEFVPKNWENNFFAWMNDIQDWCISRQLWWGHRIPAWFDKDGNIYVGKNENEVRKKYKLSPKQNITQEEDVLDTWFSSSLWTFSTLGWPYRDDLLKRYHPTDVLVTGHDIIFFWVARMLMMTTHFISAVPFKKIYIHGLVKDSEGQKMSKSKGNILDPLDVIDGVNLETLIKKRTEGLMIPKMRDHIEKQTMKEFPEGINAYGTDALRLTFCSLASGTSNINFDIKRVEGYRNFCNKLWNAARFIELQIEKYNGVGTKESSEAVDIWILDKLNNTSVKMHSAFKEYRFDLATQAIYEFTWYEFCDWYIEFSKIRLNSPDYINSDKKAILKSLVKILEKSLRLAHPLMPFITEEIWQHFKSYHLKDKKSIMISEYPKIENIRDSEEIEKIEWVKELVTTIRNIRGELKINPSLRISVLLANGNKEAKQRSDDFVQLITDMARLKSLEWLKNKEEAPPSAINILDKMKVLIPLKGLINPKEEEKRLEKNIHKLLKETESISSQLENKNFLQNAPIELVEQQKLRSNEISEELSHLSIQIKEIKKLS